MWYDVRLPIFLVVAIVASPSVQGSRRKRQDVNVGSDSDCTTPKTLPGQCIDIKSCPVLLDMLQRRTEPGWKEHLIKSQCGTKKNKVVKVCCPSIPTHELLDSSVRSPAPAGSVAGTGVGGCVLPPHPTHGSLQPQGGDCGGADQPLACDGTPGTPAPANWKLTVRCDPGYHYSDPSAANVPYVCTHGNWSIPQVPPFVIPDATDDVDFLVGIETGVRLYHLRDNFTFDTPINTSNAAWPVDYHFSKNLVFAYINHTLLKATLDPQRSTGATVTNAQLVKVKPVSDWFAFEECIGFTVDWVYDLIYWADCEGGSIMSFGLDGGAEQTVLSRASRQLVRVMEIDPYRGIVFWVEEGVIQSVRTSGEEYNPNITGSPLTSVVVSDTSLALDLKLRRVYYVNDRDNSLNSMDYTGGDEQKHFSVPQLSAVYGLSILGDKVFWNNIYNAISEAPLNLTREEDVKSLKTITDTSLNHMKVVHPSLQSLPLNYDGASCHKILRCTTTDDCTTEKVCSMGKCVDPCAEVCGPGTVCHVTNHVAKCSVTPVYSGQTHLLLNDQERCTLLNPPPNSQYRLHAKSCGIEDLPPGSAVPHDCFLFFTCAPGYARRSGVGDFLTLCSNTTWNPQVPKDLCSKNLCPPLLSEELLMKCRYGTSLVPCDKSAQPGTTVSFQCLPNFIEYPDLKSKGVYRKVITCNQSGEWSETLPPCKPECSPLVSEELQLKCQHGNETVPCDKPNQPGTTVSFQCLPNYSEYLDIKRQGVYRNMITCNTSGKWSDNLPPCKPELCPPLVSDTLQLKCRYGNYLVTCERPAQPGTTVSFQCLPNFEEDWRLKRLDAYGKSITCSKSGEWSNTLPPCKSVSECGVSKENTKFNSSSVEGRDAPTGSFPWYAALYYRMENETTIWVQKCGGSLLTNRVVLTAATCVYEVKEHDLRVALGKYYRSWDNQGPTEVRRNVTEISILPGYGEKTVSSDIALVLLSEKIKLDEYIMPVCRHFDDGTNALLNSKLYIVGWPNLSPKINGPSSETLIYTTVTKVPGNTCLDKYAFHLSAADKFCSAAVIDSEPILKQDVMGVAVTAVYEDGRHYILGITNSVVSVSYANGSDSYYYYFTSFKWNSNTEWIDTKIRYFENKYGDD